MNAPHGDPCGGVALLKLHQKEDDHDRDGDSAGY